MPINRRFIATPAALLSPSPFIPAALIRCIAIAAHPQGAEPSLARYARP